MMKYCLLILMGLLIAPMAKSQPTATLPQTDQDLDFWIGDWRLFWRGSDSTEVEGKNRITRELADHVVCEYFESPGEPPYIGKSWSVFDTTARVWKQTWVDSQGAYLDFMGEKTAEGFCFKRQFTNAKGVLVFQKMVFRAVRREGFTWDWMNSKDQGQTWNVGWSIRYERR